MVYIFVGYENRCSEPFCYFMASKRIQTLIHLGRENMSNYNIYRYLSEFEF